MTISRQSKIIAALAAIFAMGAIAGFAIARARPATAPPSVEKAWAANELRLLQKRLRLTPEQVEALRPVFAETAGKMKEVRRQTAARIAAVLKANTGQVAARLTPDQRPWLDELIREKQKRRDEVLRRLEADTGSR